MLTIRHERPVDAPAREALLDIAYGAERHRKPSTRLRRGRLPADGLSLVALEGGARCQAEWAPVSRPDSAQILKMTAPSDAKPVPTFADGAVIVGTVRLWHVQAGRGRPALLLGPLAVHPGFRGRGIGAALMRRALSDAAQRGHAAVLLVGDAAYYGRFGFIAEKTRSLRLTGADPARLLAVELKPDALTGAHGAITAAGERERVLPSLARLAKPRARLVPRAA